LGKNDIYYRDEREVRAKTSKADGEIYSNLNHSFLFQRQKGDRYRIVRKKGAQYGSLLKGKVVKTKGCSAAEEAGEVVRA